MSALTVELPDKLHEKAREIAAAKRLSMDALVAIALAQSLSRLVPDTDLEQRAARATGKGLEEFLAEVPSTQPSDSDRLPDGYEPMK